MKKIFALVLTVLVLMSATSCSWWFTTPIEDDRLPDTLEGAGDGTTAPTDEAYQLDDMPSPDDTDAFSHLGGNLAFYHADTGDCVIVIGDDGAWAFDYELNKVTPLVDFDAMFAEADQTGRGKEYFEDVEMTVGCKTIESREIMLIFHVRSNTADASYEVSAYYVLNDEISPYTRGDVRGYYRWGVTNYPGVSESIVITDIGEWGELIGYSYDHTDTWLYKIAKAFLEVDVPVLEEIMSVQSGTLKSWENAVISDYTIVRNNPVGEYFEEVTINFTLAEGSLGRWHSNWAGGEYVLEIFEGPGQYMRLYPADGAAQEPDAFAIQSFVSGWVSHRGGWYPIEEQVVENGGYMHHLIDFYLGRNNFEHADYEEFIDFCEETFGLENVAAHVSRDEVENHGGHGSTTALCDVELVASSGNNYIFEVTFWADVTETVAAKYYEIHVTDRGDGEYTVEKVECTLNNGFEVYTWGM